MRKSDGKDSSYSYQINDSNFIADGNLTKVCLLFALYNHRALALQICRFSQVKGRVTF